MGDGISTGQTTKLQTTQTPTKINTCNQTHFMNSVSIHRTLYNHVCPMKAPTNATPRGSDVSDVFFMCLRVYRQQCHNPFIMVQFSGLIINLQLRKNNYFQVIYFYIAFQRICLYFHNTKLS